MSAGQVVMTVNLRPVVVAQGAVPAFRAMQRGDRGPDVAQLQQLLRQLGYAAPESSAYDAATTSAVRSWQRATGLPVDGVVAAGDVLFLPTLPGRLALAEDVRVGAVVAAGEALFDVLSAEPKVTVTLDAAQVATVPQDAAVTVRVGDRRWEGVIASSTTVDDGSMVLALTAVDGTPVCGEDCAAIPPTGVLNVSVDVIVTPATDGPVVPTSAVRTTPSGATVVRAAPDGQEKPVEVLASARGLAVVEGVEVGDLILVPAASAGA
ncbi:peptidoglycan-binding protein [Cellulomonas septica]|uniref:Peptidoglycan-binding protein n=1 Tax=Cellulomonas septica TaxID=285080 RepID=A0ABX1K130_9CELL|nr:peptidoglycan-binding protein [Cellulomonas septica]